MGRVSVDHLKDCRHSLKTVFLDKFYKRLYVLHGAATDTQVLDDRGGDLVKRVATGE